MKRVLLGVFVLVHGCAHAAIGVWALGEGSPRVVTPLWATAMFGYFATGLGILRVPLLRTWWKQLLLAATLASLILLLVFSHGLSLIGALIDVVIVVVALERQQRCIDSDVDVVNALGTDCFEHPALHRAAWATSILALAYAAAVLAIRPLYRVDHSVTIRAPASAVWPSLVKLGEEGGWRVENAIPQRSLVLEIPCPLSSRRSTPRRHDWSFGRARLERRVLLDWCSAPWTFSCWSRRISCRSGACCASSATVRSEAPRPPRSSSRTIQT